MQWLARCAPRCRRLLHFFLFILTIINSFTSKFIYCCVFSIEFFFRSLTYLLKKNCNDTRGMDSWVIITKCNFARWVRAQFAMIALHLLKMAINILSGGPLQIILLLFELHIYFTDNNVRVLYYVRS